MRNMENTITSFPGGNHGINLKTGIGSTGETFAGFYLNL